MQHSVVHLLHMWLYIPTTFPDHSHCRHVNVSTGGYGMEIGESELTGLKCMHSIPHCICSHTE